MRVRAMMLAAAAWLMPATLPAMGQTDSTAARPAAAPDAGDGAVVLKPRVAKYQYDAMPRDPIASSFFSVVLPGAGQLYNKEYARAAVNGAVFYAGFFGAQYLLNRFQQFNTDTFFIEAIDQLGSPTGVYHQVTAPKPENEWKWPSHAQKAAFIGCVVTAGAAYLFGIYDSYQGALRYNRKLSLAAHLDDQALSLAIAPDLRSAQFALHLRW